MYCDEMHGKINGKIQREFRQLGAQTMVEWSSHHCISEMVQLPRSLLITNKKSCGISNCPEVNDLECP